MVVASVFWLFPFPKICMLQTIFHFALTLLPQDVLPDFSKLTLLLLLLLTRVDIVFQSVPVLLFVSIITAK